MTLVAPAGIFSGGGLQAYSANPVNFNGIDTFLLRGGALTGIADGSIILPSGWFRLVSGTGGTTRRIFTILAGDNSRLFVRLENDDKLWIKARNSSNVDVLEASGPTITDTAWHHFVWSIDLASTANRALYFDGAQATVTWQTYDTAGVIDLAPSSSPECAIGRYIAGSPQMWNGDMADLQFWTPASYVDLATDIGNFIANGKPVDPATAAAAYGTQIVLQDGPTDTWHTNDGSGDGFNENGELKDGSGPVQLA